MLSVLRLLDRAPQNLHISIHADRVVTPAYGAAYAAAFGNARFEVIPGAGHLPQIEQPEATLALIDAHARRTADSTAT